MISLFGFFYCLLEYSLNGHSGLFTFCARCQAKIRLWKWWTIWSDRFQKEYVFDFFQMSSVPSLTAQKLELPVHCDFCMDWNAFMWDDQEHAQTVTAKRKSHQKSSASVASEDLLLVYHQDNSFKALGCVEGECADPGGRVLQKISTRLCGPGFHNRTLGYGDRGPKSYPWLRKMGQNQTLTVGNVTNLTTFEALLHEIGQIWPKSCHLLRKKMVEFGQNGQNLLKIYLWLWTSAKIRPLATDI